MKTFDLIMRISANPDLTEDELLKRFEKFLDAIPKAVNREIFQEDCCLMEIKVNKLIMAMKTKFDEVGNILLNMMSDGPENLSKEEVDLLKQRFGDNWFEILKCKDAASLPLPLLLALYASRK